MTKIHPVYLDTNFCRDPQVLRKAFGPNVGLLLDLLVFAAARTHVEGGNRRPDLLPAQGEGRWIRFHTSDFYREFGYNRQTLLKPPSPQLIAHVFAGERKEAQQQYGSTILETTLFSMSTNLLRFTKRYYQQFGPDRQVQQNLTTLQIFQDLQITRATKAGMPRLPIEDFDGPPADLDERPLELDEQAAELGQAQGEYWDDEPQWQPPRTKQKEPKCIYISYYLRVGGIFIRNNHWRPQPLVLADYLSLRTGNEAKADERTAQRVRQSRSCTNSRLLYCRLLWRWGSWLGENTKHLTQQEERFSELCELLGWQANAVSATRLNALLQKVCALGSIPFTAYVKQSKQRAAVSRAADGSLPANFVVVLYKKVGGQMAAADPRASSQQLKMEL
jgi:hypothetical protein